MSINYFKKRPNVYNSDDDYLYGFHGVKNYALSFLLQKSLTIYAPYLYSRRIGDDSR